MNLQKGEVGRLCHPLNSLPSEIAVSLVFCPYCSIYKNANNCIKRLLIQNHRGSNVDYGGLL
jgi:hypothetical protein